MLEKNSYTLSIKTGNNYQFGQIIGAAKALECANVAERSTRPVLIITSDIQSALRLKEEIKQFTELPIIYFFDWQTLPYDNFSPHKDIILSRLSTLYKIPILKHGIIIMPVKTIMQRVCPRDFLYKYTLMMHQGQKISFDRLRTQLEQAEYTYANQITNYGQYTIHGSLFDIYPIGSKFPYRINFFDDKIDSIHLFDIENKHQIKEVKVIKLLPDHEFPTDKIAIEVFCSRWREIFNRSDKIDHIYNQVSKGKFPVGIEYWQPLFFKKELPTLFSYLPKNTLIITGSFLKTNAIDFWQDTNIRFEQKQIDLKYSLINPLKLWLSPDNLFKELKIWPSIKITSKILVKKKNYVNCGYKAIPKIVTKGSSAKDESINRLCDFLNTFTGKVIFSVENEGRRKSLYEILDKIKIYPKPITRFKEYLQNSYSIIIGASECGFIDTRQNYAFICENDVFSKQIINEFYYNSNKSIVNPYSIIRNLIELHPGQLIVHIDHGIGRYIGLTTITLNKIEAEYLIISYAGDTKLYIPISSLHLISKYTGVTNQNIHLHKLGSDLWIRTRQKAVEKIRDVAVELLDIYAKRATKTGFAFVHDNKKTYEMFCKEFQFEITNDQMQAINAVLNDMCQPLIMDRLICGDVGFGKTEVAMRAAFLALQNCKQVAILVPTTLLAQQHYNNFHDRFANWPVRIEMLSRFRSFKEEKELLKNVSEGKIDILISTHKLLMNDVKWYDLGLLIIDEEHRFGVRHKERIKALQSNVDILTLTATPIPRTLNMAMNGIRDLSIISSPPDRRLPVKTFVREYDTNIVREVILREVRRGGQVYYLYNNIDNIEKVAQLLIELVPEAQIAIGHGKMRERDLERVMNDFYHQRFNVLVCTTIIETGLDVPSANTIIIERADHFGLAQLHQLRGRVGRSYHQAYAWLLIPKMQNITTDAQQRLQAIVDLEDLGAGFALATQDLEIRGAGQLLGEEQSGQIESIGYTLYMEILENAIKALKSGSELSLKDLIPIPAEIEIMVPALLPEKFIPDINIRLSIYKKIASVVDIKELDKLKIELTERFGKLPDVAITLFDITALRLIAHKIGILKIKANEKGGFIEFTSSHKINPIWIIDLIQKHPKHWQFDGETRLKFTRDLTEQKIRIAWLQNFINELEKNCI
ncbi:transcription-repair coupling factor [Pantoea sp. Aalb]|uniref:transcription-repair coupling factor n=1 Tax=Pantoea sp. Aalb TaxID=2576762 RepID=UPI00132A490E|nr:transcription-repair coupling factor [Pantoea sp. Aalb]MXP67455.1 transcription-repair coupling factor [Pantoea sp. Aalb]